MPFPIIVSNQPSHTMHQDIQAYNARQNVTDAVICSRLAQALDTELSEAESKCWHGHPVWFINQNPIVGYNKQKSGIRLMFWSGADFGDVKLNVRGAKFKDASIFYNYVEEINPEDLKRWLQISKVIQWDYKNIVKRKGKLEKLNINEGQP